MSKKKSKPSKGSEPGKPDHGSGDPRLDPAQQRSDPNAPVPPVAPTPESTIPEHLWQQNQALIAEALAFAQQALVPGKPAGLDESVHAFGIENKQDAIKLANLLASLAETLLGPVNDHGQRTISEEALQEDRRAIQVAATRLAELGRLLPDGPLCDAIQALVSEALKYANSLRPPAHAPPRADWYVLLGGGLIGRCNWLVDRLREAALAHDRSDALSSRGTAAKERAPRGIPKNEARHGEDFTWVSWFGHEFSFKKGNQAEIVRVLWGAWEKGGRVDGRGLSQATIGDNIGSESKAFSVADTLRGHPALGKMICPSGRGTFALFKVDSPIGEE